MQELTSRFTAALDVLHRHRDVEALVELFDEDATLSKAGLPHGESGKDGARNFWTQYRNVFDAIDASFARRSSGEGVAFLEWTSTGTLNDGTDFSYDGVSVLESRDGTAIDAFRTYYDTAAFLEERRAVRS